VLPRPQRQSAGRRESQPGGRGFDSLPARQWNQGVTRRARCAIVERGRFPAAALQLFLTVDVVTSRFGTLLAAIQIPMTVEASADYICNGLCGPLAARVEIKQHNVSRLLLVRSREEHFPLFDRVSLRIPTNEVAVVDLYAACRAMIAWPDTAASTCAMFADPLWEVDQAAFDAEWGAASFPLDRYFAVAFSDPVPEPAETALFAVGALVLAGARAVRSRRR
jgi:hypothetical protein